MMKKVGIGLSGGVDSGLSAALLIEAGYNVTGYTMQVTNSRKEIERAIKVANQLGINHEVVDLRNEFEAKVIKPWAKQYLEGQTPNPCILCNRGIKYGVFAEYLLSKEDYMATGHYAKVVFDEVDQRYHLYRSNTYRKDQSYVLYQMTQAMLSRLILPLGNNENKAVTRDMAAQRGLIVSDEKDSEGICFIQGKKYSEYIQSLYTEHAFHGEIIHTTGAKLGDHTSYCDFTIGQKRQGDFKCEKGQAVIGINPQLRQVMVGDESLLYATSMTVGQCHFIVPLLGKTHCTLRMFQWGHDLAVTVERISDTKCSVLFDVPARAVAKGQSAVFYHGDEVLGGGIIE